MHVAAWGFFGIGNIGNEGTLATFLTYMREFHPEIFLSCFTLDKEVTEREHGLPAAQLMTYRADPSRQGLATTLVKAASRIWDLPRTLRLMKAVDVLVVPGCGVLETSLKETPWGLPYWLFLAALCCRSRGGRVLLVSVGAEYPSHPVTRWLYRGILRLSNYRSFRDMESRDAMKSLGGVRPLDPVVPDLVFAMPTPTTSGVRSGHVAVGVMAYAGGADAKAQRHQVEVRNNYICGLTRLISDLVDEGRTVTICVGDTHDRPVAANIERAVRDDRGDAAAHAVAVSQASTLEDLMTEMTLAEVVIATRYHNVICALKCAKPIVSLQYADKNVHLLAAFGMQEFSLPAAAFHVDRLEALLQGVQLKEPMLKRHTADLLVQFADSVVEQFHSLSGQYFESALRRRC